MVDEPMKDSVSRISGRYEALSEEKAGTQDGVVGSVHRVRFRPRSTLVLEAHKHPPFNSLHTTPP
jgi:hypothetical protein